MEREQAIRLMQDLLRRMVEKKGSDLFITAGFPPAIKVDGEIRPQSDRSLSPEQSAGMVRAMLSESLRAVVSQTLMKRVGGGRIAAHEIMIGTPAIRNLIREGKIAQMYSAIQTGQGQGMQTLDQCLTELVAKGVVSREEAKYKAQNKDSI